MLFFVRISTLLVAVGAVRRSDKDSQDPESLLDSTEQAARMTEQFNQVAFGKDLEEWRDNVFAFLEKKHEDDEVEEAPKSGGGDTRQWVDRWAGKLEPKAKAVGKGAFGKVYVATLSCNKGKVAVKQMRAEDEAVEGEANMMKAFNTPPFIHYFDHGLGADGAHYILMEAALGDTLTKVVDGRNSATDKDKAQLLIDMLTGIAEMHSKSVVHRDLKPANVLISNKCAGFTPCHAKIADLGLACAIGTPPAGFPECSGMAGTPLYIAPETYKKGIVDPANDLWALGLIYYEVLFADLPPKIGNSRTMQQLETNIVNFKIETDVLFKSMPAGPKKNLLSGMLTGSYTKRMSAADALSLAKQLLPEEDADVVGSLPPCWTTGENAVETVVKRDEGNDEDIDFFTIKKAASDIEVSFIFKADIVNPRTGVVVATAEKLDGIRKYLVKSKLKPRDKILEVNDLDFTKLRADQKDMLKSGVFGRSLTFKIARA